MSSIDIPHIESDNQTAAITLDHVIHMIAPSIDESTASSDQDFSASPAHRRPVSSVLSPTLGQNTLTNPAKLWFTEPSSFMLHPPLPGWEFVDESTLRNFLRNVVEALYKWVDQGSNAFIHSRIYKPGLMPLSAQDAFMAISAYRQRTPATAPSILRMLEAKAEALVTGVGAEKNPGQLPEASGISQRSLLERLADLHALLGYTMLRILDGDIRQRHLAENHIPVLKAWTADLLSSASQATAGDHSIKSLCEGLVPTHCSDMQCTLEQLWAGWAVTESIRRTAVVVIGVVGVYNMLRGAAVECGGTVGITTRNGVWDAGSAGAWSRICASVSCGLMHRFELLSKPADMDEFALDTLKLAIGDSLVWDWVVTG